MEGMEGVPKRRRTAEACTTDIDGISEQLQSVSLAISAAMDHGRGKDVASESGVPGHRGMEELRIWYQTEVFAATDAPQQRWEERRWAFLGQLQFDAVKVCFDIVTMFLQACASQSTHPYGPTPFPGVQNPSSRPSFMLSILMNRGPPAWLIAVFQRHVYGASAH
mmetsp:Transcript_27621/g.82717  ORF Transcript_27621/g.82717 Transcript_27621/m.82717 type:complete len:165 (-) Transcript_27621:559-1053(-)